MSKSLDQPLNDPQNQAINTMSKYTQELNYKPFRRASGRGRQYVTQDSRIGANSNSNNSKELSKIRSLPTFKKMNHNSDEYLIDLIHSYHFEATKIGATSMPVQQKLKKERCTYERAKQHYSKLAQMQNKAQHKQHRSNCRVDGVDKKTNIKKEKSNKEEIIKLKNQQLDKEVEIEMVGDTQKNKKRSKQSDSNKQKNIDNILSSEPEIFVQHNSHPDTDRQKKQLQDILDHFHHDNKVQESVQQQMILNRQDSKKEVLDVDEQEKEERVQVQNSENNQSHHTRQGDEQDSSENKENEGNEKKQTQLNNESEEIEIELVSEITQNKEITQADNTLKIEQPPIEYVDKIIEREQENQKGRESQEKEETRQSKIITEAKTQRKKGKSTLLKSNSIKNRLHGSSTSSGYQTPNKNLPRKGSASSLSTMGTSNKSKFLSRFKSTKISNV